MPFEELSWDRLYLLGWYDHSGRPHLTTWGGDRPLIHVVVHGVNGFNFPLWDAPVPSRARVEPLPQDWQGTYDTFDGGYIAIGWLLEEPFVRRSP